MAECETIKMPDGTVAIVRFSGRRKRKAKCWISHCREGSDYQCDFPLNRTLGGDVIRTCDRHLCAGHVHHSAEPGVDYCWEHKEENGKQ
jgi:hypothetical protein